MKLLDPDDVKVCNCAGCSQELLGWQHITERGKLPFPYRNMPGVRGRIDERPYCNDCLNTRRAGGGRRLGRVPLEDRSLLNDYTQTREDHSE